MSPEEQMIVALPDVMELKFEEGDSFMVIACDGIWNSMTSQAVIDYVNERIGSKSLSEIGAEVFL
jgi:serine/threonine protein phosphatase PrpC